jgi:hypothetical protein
LANEAIGELIVFGIFTALLGIISMCALFRTVTKITLRQPTVWIEKDWIHEEIEELSD